MDALVPLLIIVYGLLLLVASSVVMLLMLNNARRSIYTYYAVFLLTLMIWVFASWFLRTPSITDNSDRDLVTWGMRLLETGFGASVIVGYLLATRLTETHHSMIKFSVVAGIGLMIIFQVAFSLLDSESFFRYEGDGHIHYEFLRAGSLLYSVFAIAIIVITWQHRHNIKRPLIQWGLITFGINAIFTMLSSQFRTYSLAEGFGVGSGLAIGYALIQQDIMMPLHGHSKQLEVMRDVGLAITSELSSQEVLPSIARQAATLLHANGSAIYLRDDGQLVLQAVYNIPREFVGISLTVGQGFVGQVAQQRDTLLLQDYSGEWQGEADMPLALESFGSVIGVPLQFRDAVVGVLLVIAGKSGRRFDANDIQLMNLIGPQAAVAIINSRLFAQERALRDDLQAANQQLEAVLTNTQNPVLALNRRLQILFANPAARNLLTMLASESKIATWTEATLTEYIDPDLLPNPRHLFRDLMRDQAHVYEINFADKDYLCHITRINKPIRGWVAVLNDITQLKHVDRLKSQMVRMTTHDLKNPLFAVMTYLELLEDDGAEVFDEDMRHYMSAIWKQMTRMQRIITGILDLEKIKSGAPPMGPCQMSDIITQATAEVEHQATKKGIVLATKIDAESSEVIGDAPQLHQVVANLLDNAIKFTPGGGKIWLRAYNEDQTLIIEVEDTGIGIPREVQNQVFDRFFRVEPSYTTGANGLGLGLSLVKSIVDHHKGRVWLHSEDGRGSTFYIALPVAEPLPNS